MARHATTRRRGSVAVCALVALVLMLLVGLFAVNAAWMTGARTQLDGSADAAALAGAAAFIDDAPLRGDGRAMIALAQDAATEAHRLARSNPVVGDPLEIRPNPNNDPDGDVVIGYVEQPRGPFVPADPKKTGDESLLAINAVRVRGRRLHERGNPVRLLGGFPSPVRARDANTQSTAILDGAVIGFRQVFSGVAIPLAPFALRSDVTANDSWERQVVGGGGPDEWAYNRDSRSLVKHSDDLHEMSARLIHKPDEKDNEKNKDKKKGDERGNVFLLTLGDGSARTLSRQIADGLTRGDLTDYGGEFVLESDGGLIAAGSRWAPERGEMQSAMRDALNELRRRGEVRAWPLFAAGESATRARIIGFVAARVAEVRDDGKGGIAFELQPTRFSTPTAVTAIDRGRPSHPSGNVPYVVKLRLVD